MGEERRQSKSKSKQSSSQNRSNPSPPPRRRDSGGGGRERNKRDGAGRSMGTSHASSMSRPSRTRETTKVHNSANHNSRSRSKSKPRESPRNSRSRSKSRPREENKSKDKDRGSGREDRRDGGGNRPPANNDKTDKRRDKSSSRSKSRPRQSKSQPQDKSDSHARPSPQKQQSKKPSKHNNSNNTRSNSQRQHRSNGTRSSPAKPKKQPSSKKRQKFADAAQKAIPATVRMISGSHDAQTSADVSNINSQFQLPSPAGKSGGACTAALLQVLYQHYENDEDEDDLSWVDVLRRMRNILDDKGFEQIPQLTSSRFIDVRDPFVITPTDGSFNYKHNTQRAVLIGINYTGQSGELSGCHNDVHNVARYLTEVQGFRKENVTILMDDGMHKAPTKSAILGAYKRLVKESREGDVVFCHYSGHGGRLPDDNGDEEDGYDETLIPVDYDKKGQIRDDDLLKILIHPMPKGVTMTCLMDCCHSGTVLDLPYRFTADGDVEEMEMNERCDFKDALWSGFGLAVGMAAGNAVANAAVSALTPDPPAPEMMILGGGPNAIHEYSDTDCCAIS